MALTFERWMGWLFSDKKDWDSDVNSVRHPDSRQSLEFMTRPFTECDSLLAGYSDQRVYDGLYRILSNSHTAPFGALYERDCP